MKKLTRKEILAMFKEEVLPYIKEQYRLLWPSVISLAKAAPKAAGGRETSGVGRGFC